MFDRNLLRPGLKLRALTSFTLDKLVKGDVVEVTEKCARWSDRWCLKKDDGTPIDTRNGWYLYDYDWEIVEGQTIVTGEGSEEDLVQPKHLLSEGTMSNRLNPIPPLGLWLEPPPPEPAKSLEFTEEEQEAQYQLERYRVLAAQRDCMYESGLEFNFLIGRK